MHGTTVKKKRWNGYSRYIPLGSFSTRVDHYGDRT